MSNTNYNADKPTSGSQTAMLPDLHSMTNEEIKKQFYELSVKQIESDMRVRQLQKMLEEKHEHALLFKLLAEEMLDLIALTDMEGNFTFAGKTHETLGYEPDCLIGKNVMDFVHPEDKDRILAEFDEFLASGHPSRIEYRYRRKDGTYIWFETIGRIIADEISKPQKIIFSSRDITARKRMEKELRESEGKYRLLVETSNDIVWVFAISSMSYTYCSKSVETILGYSQEEVKGFKLDNIFLQETKKSIISAFDKVFKGERNSDEICIEAEHLRKDGSLVWMEISAIMHRDNLGTPVSFTGVSRDISEHKKAAKAIENERAFLSAVIDNIGEAIVICDSDGRISRFNETARRLHGLPEQPIPSEQWAAHYYLYQEDGFTPLPMKDIPLFRALQGEHVKNAEILVAPNNSSPYFLVCNGQALKDEKGKIYGAVVAMHNITERKRMEKALRESEQRFRIMLDRLPAGVFAHEASGRILFVNDMASRNTGYSNEELLSMSIAEIDPDSVSRNDRCHLWNELKLGESVKFEAVHVRKDGSQYSAEIHLTALELQGMPVLLPIAFDITGRKQAEREKERLQAQLAQAQKMESVGRLAGGVAHDFNNKLSIINGYAELTLDMLDPEKPAYENLKEIYDAGRRSANIVRQLLAFARRQTISPVMLDLNDAISNMLKMLQRMIGENIDLVWHPGKNLHQVVIDPSQLDQIMANLAVNARDAISDVGRLTIETENVVVDVDYCRQCSYFVPGKYVMLAVSDNGCGMEKEIKENLFEPFFTTKEVGRGTGLGLSTIYGIVKQNKGFIHAYSEPGQGTTFKIYLPSHEEPVSGALEHSTESANQIPTGSETILLVEDEPAILQMGREMLKKLGYTILTAEKPDVALQHSQEYEGSIDLLITDVVMPEMNGLDLSVRLSKNHHNLKTLYMSGYTADVIAHHEIIDKGLRFIQKPFSLKNLAVKVREVLEQE